MIIYYISYVRNHECYDSSTIQRKHILHLYGDFNVYNFLYRFTYSLILLSMALYSFSLYSHCTNHIPSIRFNLFGQLYSNPLDSITVCILPASYNNFKHIALLMQFNLFAIIIIFFLSFSSMSISRCLNIFHHYSFYIVSNWIFIDASSSHYRLFFCCSFHFKRFMSWFFRISICFVLFEFVPFSANSFFCWQNGGYVYCFCRLHIQLTAFD